MSDLSCKFLSKISLLIEALRLMELCPCERIINILQTRQKFSYFYSSVKYAHKKSSKRSVNN